MDKIAHLSVSGMLYLAFYAFTKSMGWALGLSLIIGTLWEIRGLKEDSWRDMMFNIVGIMLSMWWVSKIMVVIRIAGSGA
ncbi:MAG: hypothetical protein KAU50_04475 [Candidatus Marinimicrobia bacterium]|nr:hypothetical protein [Candidatus Neomarinimicrobiota bacterium]